MRAAVHTLRKCHVVVRACVEGARRAHGRRRFVKGSVVAKKRQRALRQRSVAVLPSAAWQQRCAAVVSTCLRRHPEVKVCYQPTRLQVGSEKPRYVAVMRRARAAVVALRNDGSTNGTQYMASCRRERSNGSGVVFVVALIAEYVVRTAKGRRRQGVMNVTRAGM